MDELTDEAIEVFIDRFGQTKGPMTAFLLEHVHGAATRVPDPATAFARTIGFNVLIPSVWLDAADTTRTSAGHRRASSAPAAPAACAVRELHGGGHAAGEAAARAAYGSNFDRLVDIKIGMT